VQKPGVLIIAGPTASGKTELALALAEAFDAEIVGADSRQIYRGMTIGTAAPSADQRARVRHHLVEFLDPHERYSAARFTIDALAAVDDAAARGKRTIVAGGTGFYVRTLAGDVTLAAEHDDAVRRRLAREARVHPHEVLHAWLAALDPARAAAIDPADPYRVSRALEIALVGRGDAGPQAATRTLPSLKNRSIAVRKLYLAPAADELARRIEARVDRMLAAGFLEEAERVGGDAVAADAVGYREALAYLQGRMTLEELRDRLSRATRRYAKRQATWFRTEPDLLSIPTSDAYRAAVSAAREIPGWA
jgi:tRNA dimethylallyltransferase